MSSPAGRTMSGTDWLILMVLAFLWGSSFMMIAIALPAIPPFTLIAIRMMLAALLLYLVLRFRGQDMPVDRQAWIMFVVLGATGAYVPFGLISWAQYQIPSSLAAILNATVPLFSLGLAHILTQDEKLSARRLAGVTIGFCGVVVMFGFDVLLRPGSHIVAMVAVLLAAVCFAFSAVYGTKLAGRGIAPLAAATGQIIAAAILALPIALVFDQPWLLPVPGIGPLLAVFSLAAGSTAFAYIMLYGLLERAGAVNLTLVAFLIPVTAIILGAVFLGERLSIHHFVGMAVIGLGLGVIDGRPLNVVRHAIRGR